MTRLPTTTTSGNTHYPNCYKNLQQDYADTNKQFAALQTTFKNGLDEMALMERENSVLKKENAARKASDKSLHDEIHRQSNNNIQLMLDNEQLKVEASMSIANRKEMEFYKKSARLWCVGFTMLLASWLAVAVWL